MDYKNLKLVCGTYNGVRQTKINIPINIDWVKFNGIPEGGVRRGHTCYWSILRDKNDINELKNQNNNNRLKIHKILEDLAVIYLDDVYPIDNELNIVDSNKLSKSLIDIISVQVSNISLSVKSINRVISIKHPSDTVVQTILLEDFFNDGREFPNLLTVRNMNLSRIFPKYNSIDEISYYSLTGEKGKIWWKSGINKVLSNFDTVDSEIDPNIIWKANVDESLLKDDIITVLSNLKTTLITDNKKDEELDISTIDKVRKLCKATSEFKKQFE